MTQYSYPLITGGYKWNFQQRVHHAIGKYPTISDVGDQTFLSFEEELTEQEKAAVDAIVGNNPCYPPTPTGTVFHVEDLWERFDQFLQAAGVDLKLYFCETVPGSGNIDRIELQANATLTQEQINQVKSAYANLITNA